MTKKTKEVESSDIRTKQEKWCVNDEQKDILARSYEMAERRGEGELGSKWFELTDEKAFKEAMAKAEAEQKEKKERQGSERKLWKLYRQLGKNTKTEDNKKKEKTNQQVEAERKKEEEQSKKALDELLGCGLTFDEIMMVIKYREEIGELPLIKKWKKNNLLEAMKEVAFDVYKKNFDKED